MSDIVDLLNKLKQDISNSIRVCMPAKVESYDFKTQKASVKIDMKELFENGTTLDYPVVSGVPVVFMASGGASITMPVLKGDNCLLIFADRDLSNWLFGGSGQKPNSTRMHNLSDAIAIMGLSSFNTTSKAENNTDVLINYSGSKITIKPDGVLSIETTKDININSGEVINVSSKNINVTSSEDINVNSKNINVTSNEDININCNNANVTAQELINVNSKNINLTTTEDTNITCNNSNIIVNETANISSKNIIINNSEVITVNSKTANITTSENVNITCVDAVITASNEIKTTSVKFIQTGDMSISGNLELGGNASGIGGNSPVSFSAGITNKGDINNDGDINNYGNIVNSGGTIRSGIVILDTHTHGYSAPVVGSEPTAAIPSTTSEPV